MVEGVSSPRWERLDTVESSSERGNAAGRVETIPSVDLSTIEQRQSRTYTQLKRCTDDVESLRIPGMRHL